MANIGRTINIFSVSIGQFATFPNELRYLTALSSLTINNINFPRINSSVFHNFENTLTSLEMSYSMFDLIPSAVCRLKHLQKLTVDHSANFNRHPSSIFSACNHQMTNVTTLSLMYDKLTSIPKIASIFPMLQFLFLDNNALQFI